MPVWRTDSTPALRNDLLKGARDLDASAQFRLAEQALGQIRESVVITSTELEEPGPAIVYVNAAFTRMTGYPPEEVIGKSPRFLQGPKTTRKTLDRLRAQLEKGDAFEGEDINYRKDGSEFYIDWYIEPLRGPDGAINYWVAVQRDVTERRALELQLFQAQRLEAVGLLASGIAHDLNNGLSLILGYGDMLLSDKENVPPGSMVETYLQEMVLAGRDNAELVKRLREFYRPADTREPRQAVDLNELIDQVLTLTAPKWQAQADARGATIKIRKDFCDIPFIAGVPDELREVLTNLIFNAVDAMPKGGRLCLRTRGKRSMIRLEVSDTGTGMTEEVRRNCLEPFFTTKGEPGSGLGLAMSYGIIRRHGGTIAIESTLNKGTTFSISFPVPKEALQPSEEESERSVRPLHVLVVDDHPGIREIVSAYLAEDRHVVETAGDATEALKKFRADRFDLVITDRAMPETSGDELAASIKEIEPLRPVIMLTGFDDLIEANGGPSRNVDLVLNKPARLGDLRKAILEVMPEKRASAHPPKRVLG